MAMGCTDNTFFFKHLLVVKPRQPQVNECRRPTVSSISDSSRFEMRTTTSGSLIQLDWMSFFPNENSWFPYISCRDSSSWSDHLPKSPDHSISETKDFISNPVRGQVCQILPVRLRSLEPQCGMRQHWAHPQCPGIRNPDSCLLLEKQLVINLAHSWILFWGKTRMRFVNQIWYQHFMKHSSVWAWTKLWI